MINFIPCNVVPSAQSYQRRLKFIVRSIPFFSDLDLADLLPTNGKRLQSYRCVRLESKKISNDQELVQSDPISYPQNQKGNN